ncbi:MAG: sulfatase-like hydrolase/transferase [Bryobacter sp.]
MLASLAAAPLAVRGQQRPNILFLFADDQRADLIHAHGNPNIQTPNLDRLVARSTSFRQNYVFGGNSGAVCMPSRAMIMTGKTWFEVDSATLKGETLLPEILGRSGYRTYGVGKWHNGQESFARGFQNGRNIMFGGMSNHEKVPVRDLLPGGKYTEVRTGEKFSSELFADTTIDFLRNHKSAEPFFSYTAFTAPHDPRQPLSPYKEHYYKKLPPLPANFQPQLGFDNGMMRNIRDENLAAWPRTEGTIREQLAEYYALMTHLDAQIGRILKTLEETGKAGNTIIVYAADNGLALGSHGLLGKQNVFEHSMRTPLLISGPGLPKGQSSRSFTYLYDIFPTLLDLAGLAVPNYVAGHSLKPVLRNPRHAVRDSVFLPFLDIQRAIRDERYKLIAYPKLGHLQLFDLQKDPHEKYNLIGDTKLQPVVTKLLARLQQWQAKVGDKVSVPTSNTNPPVVDLSGQARKPDQWQPEWIVEKYFGKAQ